MIRLVLRGQDAEILPLLTRLRLSGKEDIRGLIPRGKCRDLELYAEISRIPVLDDAHWDTWRGELDYLVSSDPLPPSLEELPHLSLEEAVNRFLLKKQESPQIPLEERESRATIEPSQIHFDFSGFAHELRREIRRSRRYHLGFCFTLFRLVDTDGEVMKADRFLVEPLLSLPTRVGRMTDSWGISPEGVLLHLAPEIQEQARLLKRRLSDALENQVREFEDSPWRCQSAQALYPQNGEKASELIRHAMDALSRRK